MRNNESRRGARALSAAAMIFALGAFSLFGFHGCLTGGEIPNELTGTVASPGGAAAPLANVELIPVDHAPGTDPSGTATIRATADAQGRFVFTNVPVGTYNLISARDGAGFFQDSIVVKNGSFDVGVATLRPLGALAGRVLLEDPDSPRLALVQVMGTEIYVNVDSLGRFALTDMPAGHFRIRVFVAGGTYMPEFRAVTIVSGKTDTVPDISPYYLGPPRITGLQAVALADGSIRLSWNAVHYSQPFTYGIFREPANFLELSGNAMAYVTAPVLLDTIYAATPRPDAFGFKAADWPNTPYGGQFPLTDTTAYAFRYKVWAFTNDGQTLGTPSAYVKVVAIPPKP